MDLPATATQKSIKFPHFEFLYDGNMSIAQRLVKASNTLANTSNEMRKMSFYGTGMDNSYYIRLNDEIYNEYFSAFDELRATLDQQYPDHVGDACITNMREALSKFAEYGNLNLSHFTRAYIQLLYILDLSRGAPESLIYYYQVNDPP